MTDINVRELRANLHRVMREVHAGQDYTVTVNGMRIASLRPYAPEHLAVHPTYRPDAATMTGTVNTTVSPTTQAGVDKILAGVNRKERR